MRRFSHHMGYFIFGAAAFLLVATQLGCGPESGLDQDETLAFENTARIADNSATLAKKDSMDLGADEANDFWLNYYPPVVVPYAPAPLFDYYTQPLAVEVPVSPVAAVVDYVHPFYAYRHIGPSWYYRGYGHKRKFHHDDD